VGQRSCSVARDNGHAHLHQVSLVSIHISGLALTSLSLFTQLSEKETDMPDLFDDALSSG
jgi:hypothetical protein